MKNDYDKISGTLTLIARVSVGVVCGNTVSADLWCEITKMAEGLPDECRQLGLDIINDNKSSKVAQQYRQWAISIRRGAGDSQRKRQEIIDRLNCTCKQ